MSRLRIEFLLASVVAVFAIATGCTDEVSDPVGIDDPVPELVSNEVDPPAAEAQETVTGCMSNERLVEDACTELGPGDECTNIEDVCIALCDGLQTCTTSGKLRPLTAWPTAPNGYCVECDVP
jgi:hypothetical protein